MVGPVRTFIVDDHHVVREGFRLVVAHAPGITCVGEGATAREAIGAIPSLRPDVAIVDVRLPDGSGIEVIRHVRRVVPSVRCLIFTAHTSEDLLLKAAIAGAVGYVPKQAGAAELVAAVRRAAAGQALIDKEALERARSVQMPDAALSGPLGRLTPHETRIVNLVVDGCTNREIAEQLHLAEKTVRNYVSSVLAKMGARNRTQLAVAVAGALANGRR